MNSSITLSIFRVRPSTVVSNWKSSAHRAFGRIGHIAPTWVPIPVRRFLRFLVGTRRPSSRHRRRIRLLFTCQPALRAAVAARRHPHRGRRLENVPQELPQPLLVIGDRRRGEALGGAVLADHGAGSSFGDPEPVTQHRHGAALAVRGQKFPSAISRNMSMSSAWFATSFFNRAFSRLELLEPLRVVGLHPAVLGEPAMPRRLRDLEMPAHLVELLARRELPVAFVELADDLFRRVPPALLWSCRCASSCPHGIRVAQRLDHYEGLTSISNQCFIHPRDRAAHGQTDAAASVRKPPVM